MSVLKNKRRTSKIEYEKNFLGFYEYMMSLIDHIPKRWQKPLGAPMKEALNQMYDDVLLVSEMYIEKEQSKTRYLQCRKVIEELTAFQEWICLYWNLSDGRNGIKWADADRRKYMSIYLDKEIYLLAGVMVKLDQQKKFGAIEVSYLRPFVRRDIEGIMFLQKLYELNNLVYTKSIRIPLAQRDEEVALACKYIRNAFYCAYTANSTLPSTKREYERRRKMKKFRGMIGRTKLTADDVYASIQSWITHARVASSYHAVKAMLALYDMMYEGYRLTRRYWKRNEDLHRKRKVVRI